MVVVSIRHKLELYSVGSLQEKFSQLFLNLWTVSGMKFVNSKWSYVSLHVSMRHSVLSVLMHFTKYFSFLFCLSVLELRVWLWWNFSWVVNSYHVVDISISIGSEHLEWLPLILRIFVVVCKGFCKMYKWWNRKTTVVFIRNIYGRFW